MSRSRGGEDDREWLFDYLLSVFRSPQWDAALMGFIDEHCAVFDNAEENQLSYTALHEPFRELVETLISSSLAEVGVAVEDVAEVMESSRFSRDINRDVYEQILALDDFQTFKKLMVKRNTELELEAVRALQAEGVPISAPKDQLQAEQDFQRMLKEADEVSPAVAKLGVEREGAGAKGEGQGEGAQGAELDRQLQEAMDANLMELELMHKQEEMEQAELEQAIAVSLALEKGRVAAAGNTLQVHADPRKGDPRGSQEAPAEVAEGKGYSSDADACAGPSAKGERSPAQGAVGRQEASKECDGAAERQEAKGHSSSTRNSSSPSSKQLPPMGMGPRPSGRLQPLALPGHGAGDDIRSLEVAEGGAVLRKKQAEAALHKNKELLHQRQQAQQELRAQAEVGDADMERRARHLREVRDRIVANKKAQREEEARKAQASSAAGPKLGFPRDAPKQGAELERGETARSGGGGGSSSGGGGGGGAEVKAQPALECGGDNDFAQERRQAMRVALAQRLKQDLLNQEKERLCKAEAEQFEELGEKLRLVEQLRQENAEKEEQIKQAIKQQQQQRARNIARSAAKNGMATADDFTFQESR